MPGSCVRSRDTQSNRKAHTSVNNKPKTDKRKMHQPLILPASQHSPSFPDSVLRHVELAGIEFDFCGIE